MRLTNCSLEKAFEKLQRPSVALWGLLIHADITTILIHHYGLVQAGSLLRENPFNPGVDLVFAGFTKNSILSLHFVQKGEEVRYYDPTRLSRNFTVELLSACVCM